MENAQTALALKLRQGTEAMIRTQIRAVKQEIKSCYVSFDFAGERAAKEQLRLLLHELRYGC